MESIHLHISGHKINEVCNLVKKKRILVLNHSKINYESNNKFIFLNFHDLIFSKSIKDKGKNSHKEILDLTKLVIKRYKLLEILLEEYKDRGVSISEREINSKLISSIYTSVCWIYQLVSIKELILQGLSKIYKVDSFSRFTVSKLDYFPHLDDAYFHKKRQFSDLWHAVIFSDLASHYFPNAEEITFHYHKKDLNKKNIFLSRKIKMVKTKSLLKLRSIFFCFYSFINKTDFLFINSCFTNNYLEKCRKELKMKMIRIPGSFFWEFDFNEYLFDLKQFKNNDDFSDLKGFKKIVVKNLPLSATTLFKSYIKFTRNYKYLDYKKIISSGGLSILTMLRYHLVLFKSKESILFTTQHGAAGEFIYPMHDFEKIYCDYFLNWGFEEKNSIAKNEISIQCTRPLKNVNRKNLDGKIYIILSAYPYQPTRLNAELNYNSVALKQIPILLDSFLTQKINSNDIVIRPYPVKTQYRSLKYTYGLEYLGNYLNQKYPFIKQELNMSGNFIQANASLIINTYFGSAGLFQRFHADLPFLVFDIFKGEWISDEFKELYFLLKKAKIIFDDPIQLAKHISLIKDDINKFWYSGEVRSALNKFNKKHNSNIPIFKILKDNNYQ